MFTTVDLKKPPQQNGSAETSPSCPIELLLMIAYHTIPSTLTIEPFLAPPLGPEDSDSPQRSSLDYHFKARNVVEWSALCGLQRASCSVSREFKSIGLGKARSRLVLDLTAYEMHSISHITQHYVPDSMLNTFDTIELRIPILFRPSYLFVFTATFERMPSNRWKETAQHWTTLSPRYWSFAGAILRWMFGRNLLPAYQLAVALKWRRFLVMALQSNSGTTTALSDFVEALIAARRHNTFVEGLLFYRALPTGQCHPLLLMRYTAKCYVDLILILFASRKRLLARLARLALLLELPFLILTMAFSIWVFVFIWPIRALR